jgi:transposase
MKCSEANDRRGLTKREQAAVARLYVQQGLTAREAAKRLRLDPYLVIGFLRDRGVLRNRGTSKLSAADRRKLVNELATTIDADLARKYGLTRERVRQIRKESGCLPTWVRRRRDRLARQERDERARRALELQRRAVLAALSKEFGVSFANLAIRVHTPEEIVTP